MSGVLELAKFGRRLGGEDLVHVGESGAAFGWAHLGSQKTALLLAFGGLTFVGA